MIRNSYRSNLSKTVEDYQSPRPELRFEPKIGRRSHRKTDRKWTAQAAFFHCCSCCNLSGSRWTAVGDDADDRSRDKRETETETRNIWSREGKKENAEEIDGMIKNKEEMNLGR